MKRTVPLLITAVSGFVLIIAFFIPALESSGDKVAIWFDLLASIAFVLGGANLLKMHLKKIADQVPGWGYSAVTILAFVITLYVGLVKWGVPPAPQQEFFGETFAPLTVDQLPPSLTFTVAGSIPQRPDGKPLPPSVSELISDENGEIRFLGWMLPNQQNDLLGYDSSLKWRCDIENLFKAAQPTGVLAGKVRFYFDHSAISFSGFMTAEHKAALLALGDSGVWKVAVEQLAAGSDKTSAIEIAMPQGVTIPTALADVVNYDATTKQLVLKGPMTAGQKTALSNQFPIARPLTQEQQTQLLESLTQMGPITPEQAKRFNEFFLASWTVDQLRLLLDEAGVPEEITKSYCELYQEQQAGATDLKPTRTEGEKVTLNAEQVAVLEKFATDTAMSVDDLLTQIAAAGPFVSTQATVLTGFLGRVSTVAEQKKELAIALLRIRNLNDAQRSLLLDEFRAQWQWQQGIAELFHQAHTPKYNWSGQYRAQGSPFWWLYEYAFKPLTATMFAILAFYVASAAFRAFRAKNFEALLLLGTAFIILLGRTFAGVLLTSFIPEESIFAFLRIENLSVYILRVFNTAGTRAIMIGIALGIASTSLRVLLGIDRSYLGNRDD